MDSEAKVQREQNIFVQATCANKGQGAAMADKQVGINNNNSIDQSAMEGQVTNDSLLEAIEGLRADINNKLKSLEDTLLVKFQSFVEDIIRQVKDDFTGQIDILKDIISQLDSRPRSHRSIWYVNKLL